MTLTLRNTAEITEINGVKARVWIGETSTGVKVQALIPRVAVLKTDDTSQFEAELAEQPEPSELTERAFPLRMIL